MSRRRGGLARRPINLAELRTMRVVIASRIFEPEPSAASFRLQSLAETLAIAGHLVEVKTAKPPAALPLTDSGARYTVTRWPVKRDKQGYVRGYVSYMSFDIPLFFRLLFSRRPDAVVVEPPPTTGFMVRLACALRRVPYYYYAADVWGDAAQQTGAPSWMIRIVRGLETWAWKGARVVLSVSEGVTQRITTLIGEAAITTVGNGVNSGRFLSGITEQTPHDAPYFVYAGTASEWHGAVAFIEAFALAGAELGATDLVFIGGGSEREELERRAQMLGVADRVTFLETMQPEQLAAWLRHAVASLASVRPGSGYDFAFPTKLYSSAICGAPLIYSGPGPAVAFVQTEVNGEKLGEATLYDPQAISAALVRASSSYERASAAELATRKQEVSDWAVSSVSLSSVAEKIVGVVTGG